MKNESTNEGENAILSQFIFILFRVFRQQTQFSERMLRTIFPSTEIFFFSVFFWIIIAANREKYETENISSGFVLYFSIICIMTKLHFTLVGDSNVKLGEDLFNHADAYRTKRGRAEMLWQSFEFETEIALKIQQNYLLGFTGARGRFS